MKKEELKKQMDECVGYMVFLDNGFKEALDDELVDYYIYERKATEARFRYLSQLYRETT